MGTRAVVHVDLRPVGYGKDVWIATHWDGYPKGLGESLKEEIKKEISRAKEGRREIDMGAVMEKAVWKGAAEHAIDTSTTDGKAEFDKLYGDWAEYEYDVDAKKGKIKVRERSGDWQSAKIGSWKSLETALAKEKLKKVV
jgi:hypothetical protein